MDVKGTSKKLKKIGVEVVHLQLFHAFASSIYELENMYCVSIEL